MQRLIHSVTNSSLLTIQKYQTDQIVAIGSTHNSSNTMIEPLNNLFGIGKTLIRYRRSTELSRLSRKWIGSLTTRKTSGDNKKLVHDTITNVRSCFPIPTSAALLPSTHSQFQAALVIICATPTVRIHLAFPGRISRIGK